MNNNQNNIKNLIDFSNIDINDINVSNTQNQINNSSLKADENGLYNNLDDFDLQPNLNIKIFGIGGAGNNIIEHIAKNSDIDPTMLYAINTDLQVLKKMTNVNCSKILIGKKTTRGYGSGSDPIVGEKAADEDRKIITDLLKGVDLLFIVSGMGKGTGTGASPIIASIAKELNILTISIVNVPSIQTEGKKIYDKGSLGINNLKKYVDGIATINNDKILGSDVENESLFNCFKRANQVISDTIRDLIHTVNVPNHINIDFNDIKNFFKDKTHFQITNCEFESNENSKEILKQKISSTLFEDKLLGSKKAILTLRLNTNVPQSFIFDVRKVIEELTENQDLELTYSIDYSEEISFAKISILIATNYFSHANDEDVNKMNESHYIFDLEQKINKFESEHKENNETKNSESKAQVDDNIQENYDERIESVNDILNNVDKMEANIINNNPNKINVENDAYNLDDISFHNKDYDSLNKELIATKEMMQQKIINNQGSTILETNQSQINSTRLNNFISKTLTLFKNNSYNRENENK